MFVGNLPIDISATVWMVFDTSLSSCCHSAARIARTTWKPQLFQGQRVSWEKKIPNQSALLAVGNGTGK